MLSGHARFVSPDKNAALPVPPPPSPYSIPPFHTLFAFLPPPIVAVPSFRPHGQCTTISDFGAPGGLTTGLLTAITVNAAPFTAGQY